ncbi:MULTISPECIES: ATP/GTP-binding protein [unclassified Adlercreutzia]|uniref:AAA family ATPase n=1 Tax=unclassified Adlercreutzia TaxID=2636013 RepID=UPI0013EBBFD4|nr:MULTISPECIES: ATP-binding protein [unclassified Adlercreutzia]
MLVSFTFENFKCYRDEAELSMEAAGIAEHSDTLLEGLGGRHLLPVAVLYGPNGGGKSSALQAFECLCRSVAWPWLLMRMKGGRAAPIECRPYAFDAESAASPTTFRAVFEAAGYTYRYVLSVNRGKVEEEYLHRRKPGKGSTATLFERSDGKIELGSSLRRKGVSTKVDTMMPLLSFLAINYDLEPVDTAFAWFLGCKFLDYSQPNLEDYMYGVDDKDLQRRVVRMLNGMDIDITGIRYQRDGEDRLEGVYLTHEAGGDTELELAEESNGTKKLLGLAPRMLDALASGSLVVSDEMDAKLHPKLLRYVIRLFTDPATNPNRAQLVFTSHDMSTLNSATFRRDEIWFAAKGDSGASELYSLADIVDVEGKRIRTQNAYDRQYLAGQYGADPYLRSMLEWGAGDEQ